MIFKEVDSSCIKLPIWFLSTALSYTQIRLDFLGTTCITLAFSIPGYKENCEQNSANTRAITFSIFLSKIKRLLLKSTSVAMLREELLVKLPNMNCNAVTRPL